MAIQPIDLQNMYQQLSNVSKSITNQPQLNQLASSLQQQTIVQQNLEESTKVSRTNEDAQNTNNIDADGKNDSSQNQRQSSEQKHENQNDGAQKSNPNNPPFVGTIIDITR